jgi:N-(2-amino-2-carboxyethyl)-L-glutamate synthase
MVWLGADMIGLRSRKELSHDGAFDKGLLGQVGGTPLIRLHNLERSSTSQVYAKAEFLNPGGSVKDRTAKMILKEAWERGRLSPGSAVVESSSGNMAVGLAQTCKLLDLKFIAVVDPHANRHSVDILKAYGAQVREVSRPHSKEGFLGARIRLVKEIVRQNPTIFWPNQYLNPSNPKAHYQTMAEIHAEFESGPDYLFVATSTCGTLMGCRDYIEEYRLSTRIVAVDAVGSVLFGTRAGDRLLPGHGASRPSKHLKQDAVHRVVHITDWGCVVGCHSLMDREALLCGASSGAVALAWHSLRHELPSNCNVVLLLADRGERYLDTVYSDKWLSANFTQYRGADSFQDA